MGFPSRKCDLSTWLLFSFFTFGLRCEAQTCAANVTHNQLADADEWTLTEPNVKQRITDCTQIEIKNNDLVTVSAAGCVHTVDGWKSYVNPRGTNSDRLYHGLIWLPGATANGLRVPLGTDLAPIAGALGHSFVIASDRTQSIKIGYQAEAGSYSANSFGGGMKKAGANSCSITARLTISVHHTATAATEALKSFDLVSTSKDDNDLLLSPQWSISYGSPGVVADPSLRSTCDNFKYWNPFLTNHGVRSPCSDQPSFDTPWRPVNPIAKLSVNNYICMFGPCIGRLHGHANWTPVTFQGLFYWGAHQGFDDDLDFFLVPVNHAGPFSSGIITKVTDRDVSVCDPGNFPLEFTDFCENHTGQTFQAISLEMRHRETLTNFNTSHWNYLREAVEGGGTTSDPRFLDGSLAVVTGLLGLDCVHDCHVELHPIYTIAIRVPKQETDTSNTLAGTEHDDIWMVMVRNRGDEGCCSQDLHYLNRDSYVFRLPAPRTYKGIPHAKIIHADLKSNKQHLHWEDITPANSAEAVIRITLLNPDAGSRVSGSIHVCWEEPCHVEARPTPKTRSTISPLLKRRGETMPEEIFAAKNKSKVAATFARAPSFDDFEVTPFPVGVDVQRQVFAQLSTFQADALNKESKDAAIYEKTLALSNFCGLFGKVSTDSTIGKFCKTSGEIGVFGEVFRFQRVPVSLGGIGARYSVEAYNTLALEAEASFTFPRTSAELFTNGTMTVKRSSSQRSSIILAGAAIKSCGRVVFYGTLKGGVIFTGISKSQAPAGFNSSSLDPLRVASWHGSLYSAGGAEFVIGAVSFRAEAGDLMYFNNGANHNLRITFGPNLRF
jgi:hypothetical protein